MLGEEGANLRTTTRQTEDRWRMVICKPELRCTRLKYALIAHINASSRDMDRPVDTDLMQRRPVPEWSGIEA